MKRLSILLTLVVLIVGILSCATPVVDESVQHYLTVSSTDGGSVTTPGEGTFAYDEGALVDLAATPDAGCRFAAWTGDVSTIADVDSATTTIAINGDCSITAAFVAMHNLTISSTEGGSVTNPGEGTFTYDAGSVVSIAARAEEGYQFAEWTGQVYTTANVSDPNTTITMNGDYSITARFRIPSVPMLVAGEYHTVGLKSNGTLVAVGYNWNGECSVWHWKDITQVAAGDWHTVGLKADGTVVAVGQNNWGQCDVNGWTNITQVAAGDHHTVGLKSDGTVVAVGDNDYGQCDVSDWTDIAQIAVFAGAWHTAGLRYDGTVVAVGRNDDGQCDVDDWTGIVQVAAYTHTIGLRSDGTVVAAGCDDNGKCDVGEWADIIQIAAGAEHTVGLRADGTVVAVGRNDEGQCDVSDWVEVIRIAAGAWHTVGLKSDGTVVAVGDNRRGQCNVSTWMLN